MTSLFLRLGALNGFLAVALGAFGAHGLKDKITPDMLEVYRTGAQYHLIHALALVAVALILDRAGSDTRLVQRIRSAGFLFAAGIIVFSGSLYLLAITGTRWLGAITPLGGVCFLCGWAILATASLSAPSASRNPSEK